MPAGCKEWDSTKFALLFQNRTEDDILLRDERDELSLIHSGRFSVIYFLSYPTSTLFGNGSKANERRGYINALTMFVRPEICQYIGVFCPGGFTESIIKLSTDVGHHGEEAVHVF